MVYYSDAWPLKTASICLANDDDAKTLFDEMRSDIAAFRKASEQTDPVVQRWVSRNAMREPLMQASMAAPDQFGSEAHSALRSYYTQIYRGFGTVKINEDTNKEAKAVETRGHMNRTVAHLRRWQVPVQHQMASRWGRPEMSATTTFAGPRVPKDLFRVTENQQLSEKCDFRRISKQPYDWPTIPGEDLGVLAAERSATRTCFEQRSFSRAEEFWQSDLLPEGEIVVNLPTASLYLVIRVASKVGCLMYPCSVEHDSFITLDRPKLLQWAHIDDVTEWAVVPTTITSPLRNLYDPAFGKSGLPLGIYFKRCGKDSEVLHWHGTRGFALLPDSSLEILCDACGLDLSKFAKLGAKARRESQRLALYEKTDAIQEP